MYIHFHLYCLDDLSNALCMYYAKAGFSYPTETATTLKPPKNDDQRSTGVIVTLASMLLLFWPLQLLFF
jgi:hypothetical protein